MNVLNNIFHSTYGGWDKKRFREMLTWGCESLAGLDKRNQICITF